MGRIGTEGCSKIYSIATKSNTPAYTYPDKTTASQSVGVVGIPLIESPFKSDVELKNMQSASNEMIMERISMRDNKTNYQLKIGRRSEGNRFQNAKDKPYVNYSGTLSYGDDIHANAPSIDFFDEQQKALLTKTFTKQMEQPISALGQTVELVNKFELGSPYPNQIIDKANEQLGNFINDHLGQIETQPNVPTGYTDGGSNIKPNLAEEQNQPAGPQTAKDIYINSFMSQKTVSGVHLRQLNLGKSRAILGLYGNRQQYAPVAGGGK